MINKHFSSLFNFLKLRRYILSFVIILSFGPAFAQLPADLKTVKVDALTDAQIKQYILESEQTGIPEAQQEQLAIKNGMPQEELQKLKERVAKIRGTVSGVAIPQKSGPIVEAPKPAEPAVVKEVEPAVAVAPEMIPLDPNMIYGHQFFKNNNLQLFERAADMKAPDNYIIGSNDELTISVFGFSYFNEVLKVDAKGAITPTNIGPIMLKGMEFSKAKALIRSKFAQSFDLSNNQLTVTLSYSRVITVNFVGEVAKPGSYKIPAVNTAFNALVAVGGPSGFGSVRNIQVRRNGKTVKVLDVYEYLNNPNSALDFYLQDNDYIYILPTEKVVNIAGLVKRPMFYELKDKENLDDLIRFAGGLSSTAYTKLIDVSRLNEDGTQRQLINISIDSLRANKRKFNLIDGDQISIGSKQNELRQFVRISGPVYRPGDYQFVSGDRISDLIKRANGLRKEAKLDRAYLIRMNVDKTLEYIPVNLEKIVTAKPDLEEDKLLREGDAVKLFAIAEFIDVKSVTVSGLFRKPGTYDLFEGMRLADLVFLAGGVREEANRERVFLIRTKPDFTKEFISLNIDEALNNLDDSLKNRFLERGDVLTMFSVKDFIDAMSVNAVGLFRRPGSFDFVNGMTISDLLFLAGGLRMEADLLNIEISRISFFAEDYKMGDASRVIIKTMQVGKDTKLTDDQLNFRLNPYDQVFVRMIPDFELPRNLTINGEVKYPGVYALASKDERLDQIIKRSGGLNRFAFAEGSTLYRSSLPGGYVVMNLKKALANPKSTYNYILKEGDVINVPRVIDLIAIRGNVEYLAVINQEQVNSPFIQGRRANYYIKEFANGFTKTSFKRKTYIVENNGKVDRTRNYVLFKVYPKVKKGSTIYVVTKPVKAKETRQKSEPVNWTTVIERTTVKITGLITLYLLLKTVSGK